MKATSFLLMIPFGLFSCSAVAQEEEVLRGNQITESALIQALTPAPELAEDPIRTRSIRVNPANEPRPASAKPAKASLLITFKTNSAALTPHAKQSLDVVGQALTSNKLADFRFAIQGHADPRGDSESNLRLSQLRAESVRQYLVQNNHIEDERLEAVGRGDKELLNTANPIAPENRRVTIVNLSK
ncbi:MAG: OmpA family protein [Pseudomonadota bacterium]|nr:OmpA family protein [Pseudomonadota bacterium]